MSASELSSGGHARDGVESGEGEREGEEEREGPLKSSPERTSCSRRSPLDCAIDQFRRCGEDMQERDMIVPCRQFSTHHLCEESRTSIVPEWPTDSSL